MVFMKKLFAATALSLFSVASLAGGSVPPITVITPGGSTANYDTKAYVGLNWAMGGSLTPAVVLGANYAKVKSNGDTNGADVAFSFNLLNGFAPGTLKLSYLNGKDSGQGLIGAGYNFAAAAPVVGMGWRAPYVTAGADMNLHNYVVTPSVTLTTQGAYDAPDDAAETVTTTCPPGSVPNGDRCET